MSSPLQKFDKEPEYTLLKELFTQVHYSIIASLPYDSILEFLKTPLECYTVNKHVVQIMQTSDVETCFLKPVNGDLVLVDLLDASVSPEESAVCGSRVHFHYRRQQNLVQKLSGEIIDNTLESFIEVSHMIFLNQ